MRIRIRDPANARPRFEYLRIWVLQRREDWLANRKWVRLNAGSRDGMSITDARRFGRSAERATRLHSAQQRVEIAVIESFNGQLRYECLNANVILSLHDARQKIEAGRIDDIEHRLHGSLGNVTSR